MRIECRAIGMWFAIFVIASTVFAHHSLLNTYELDETVALAGTISEVQWSNPHVRLELETTGDSGEISMWSVEIGSPNQMERGGVDSSDIGPGAEIRIDAWIARDGSPLAAAQSLRLSDGSTFTDGALAWSRGNESSYVNVRATTPDSDIQQ